MVCHISLKSVLIGSKPLQFVLDNNRKLYLQPAGECECNISPFFHTQLLFPYLEKFSKVFTVEVVAEELVIIFTTIKLMTNLFKASQKPLES